MHSMKTNRPFVISLALALSLVLGLSSRAATNTVTSNADSGAGSLRDTIAAAASGDTIEFDPSLSGQTITLGSQLTLTNDLTIDASALGAGLTVSGSNAVRIISITDGNVTVVLKSLTLANGRVAAFYNGQISYAQGGGIYNSGTLTLNQCAVRNCVGNPSLGLGISQGGGIYNSGTLSLNGSTVQGCSAVSDETDNVNKNGAPAKGGGIYNDINGVLSLINSTIQSNSVTGGNGGVNNTGGSGYTGGNGEGAGIYNAGTISICSQTTFASNSALGGNGGNGYSPPASANIPGGAGGVAGGAAGGGIYNAGTLTLVSQCAFSANSANGGVAGLGRSPSSGGKGLPGAMGGNGGDATGGGIYNQSAGTLSLRQSTFSGNSVLGGIGGQGGAGYNGITNSPTAGGGNGGNGGRGGDSGAGSGGGIYNAGAIPLFTQCTFSSNSASGNIGGNGGNGGNGDALSGGGTGSPGRVGGSGGDGGRGRNGAGGHLYNLGMLTLLNQGTFAGNSGTGGTGGNGGKGGSASTGQIGIPQAGGYGGQGGDAGNSVNGGTAGNGGDGGGGGLAQITGKTGGPGGNGGSGGAGGNGGSSGIYNAGTMAMSGSILSSPTATGGSGGSGGAAGAGGGAGASGATNGPAGSAGTAGLAGCAFGADTGSVMNSQGHNLLRAYDQSGGTFNGVASDVSVSATTDLLLGSLTNNGGTTFTMALLPGSPAIDAGDDTVTDTLDQRGTGFPRNVGGHVDIGAYEFDAVALGYSAPVLVSQTAGSVTIALATGLGSLTISNTMNANGLAATGYIQYGVGTSFGDVTTPVAYGNGTSNVPVNLPLTGLSPGITWHYRVVTANAAGSTYGADQTVAVGTPGDVNGDGIVDLYSQAQYDANGASNFTAGVSAVTNSPNTYSLYTLSQVQALNVDAPLLQRDGSNQFKLTIGVEKATQLTNFFPFPMTAPQTTINGDGKLEFLFTSPDNAAFFRLQAQ
jgi:hypothetical protein